jgi:hypothetical protein
MSEPRKGRPTINDVDPRALAVHAMPDEIRTAGNADETDHVVVGGDFVSTESLDEQGEDEEEPVT